MKALDNIADKLGDGTLSVGFMSGATYPDGQTVAQVAFKNEYGDPANNQPPRPFFRRMIAKDSPAWSGTVGKLVVATNYDGNKALEIMGENIMGELQQSIQDLVDPPLSPTTIALKGFSKPLIDTGQMQNSITSRVD